MQQTLSRIQRRNTSRQEVQATYNRLNDFIQKINQKIVNRLQLVQQVYVQDYKAQVKQMTDQLKTIRAVLDEELLRQRANQRLFFLEEERDFFRGQVMKLSVDFSSLNKVNDKLKQSLEQSQAEAKNYRNIVYGLQKKIRRLQDEAFQNEKIKQMSQSTSMPFIQPKSAVTISPEKTVSTKLTAVPLSNRLIHRSVETKRDRIQDIVDVELKRKQQILYQCIKDVKKKIFYRSLNEGNNIRTFFNVEKKVTFDKFTRNDKQELIQSILCHPEILQKFYAFMTNGKQSMPASNLKLNKSAAKTSFSDKIFKIKMSGVNADNI